MSVSGVHRVNFRPQRLITALRVVIGAFLAAFGVVLFLSFGKKEEQAVRIHLAPPPTQSGEQVCATRFKFAIVQIQPRPAQINTTHSSQKMPQ